MGRLALVRVTRVRFTLMRSMPERSASERSGCILNVRSPLIPGLHPLLQPCKMFLVRHCSHFLHFRYRH